jgi:succinoglycan biosynthesis transport protein ExoP
MTLAEYLGVFRRYWFGIVVLALIGALGGYALGAKADVKYRASTSLLVSTVISGSGSDILQGTTYVEKQISSYVGLVTSQRVLQSVVDDLHLKVSAKALAGQVTADSPTDTTLIDISAVSGDPVEAASIANSVTSSLAKEVAEVAPQFDGKSAIKLTTVKTASVPNAAFAPNRRLYIIVGLLAGFLMGLVLALTRRSLGSAINDADDVARVTDLPVVGEIVGSKSGTTLPAAVLREPTGLEAESVRGLAANLSFLGVDHGLRSLVITSASQGESKSSLSASVSLVLAEGANRVLLIDADLRKPSIHRLTNLDNSIGLSTVLIGKDTLEVAAQPWGNDGLDVLTSGPAAPNPAQLLSSQAMRALVAKAEASYDYIVIDTAPLLSVADAVWLSHVASGMLVAVRRGKTHPRALRRAMEIVTPTRTSVLGLVITRVRRSSRSKYAYKTNHSS